MDERSKLYLSDKFDQKVDLDERTLYLRLDKYKSYDGNLVIAEGGDIIKLELSYNAYTKKSNTIDNIRKFLNEYLQLEESG